MKTVNDIVSAVQAGEAERIYQWSVWARKRSYIMKRDHNECQYCKAKGSHRRARCVHHIVEIKDRPDLALDNDNLIALCHQCHDAIHNRTTDRFRQEKKKPEPEHLERWD